MSTALIESHKKNAEIYTDPSECKIKYSELLARMNLPKGLFPLDVNTIEVGYHEETGFVWRKQKNKKHHMFKTIGRTVSYDKEVTAFVENRKMTKVKGVQSKDLLIWITVSDVSIKEADSGKITFTSISGLYRTFPVSAFEKEEGNLAS